MGGEFVSNEEDSGWIGIERGLLARSALKSDGIKVGDIRPNYASLHVPQGQLQPAGGDKLPTLFS